MKIINGLSKIAGKYKCFVLDAWGVLHDGHAPFKHVIETLACLKSEKKQVIILTNSPSRISDVSIQLKARGISEDLYDDIISSGEYSFECIKAILEQNIISNKYFYVGQDKHQNLLAGLNIERREKLSSDLFILNAGPYCQLDSISKYDTIFSEAIDLGINMICVNPDKFVIKNERLAMCAGSLAKKYEEMGGGVWYYGKPYLPIYAFAKQKITYDSSEILVVGDSLDTDIKGGISAGFDTMLVLSGIFGMSHRCPDKMNLSLKKDSNYYPNYILNELMW